MRAMAMAGAFVLAWLALAGSAAALCTCGDRDGCGSAAACAGQIPGHECGTGRTCKIVVGTGNDLTCCCGCSRGVGPTACNYGALGAIDLPDAVACDSQPLGKLTAKVESGATAKLGQADEACRAGKNAIKKARGARGQLGRLRKKIDRFEKKGKIEPACAAAARELVDQVLGDIDALEGGEFGGGGGGGTTTTSTTLPGPSCGATFVTYPPDPFEVDFEFGCFAAGADYSGFVLQLNGGRQVTNFLSPVGFDCAVATRVSTNDSLACDGAFNIDVMVTGGRLRTSPAPAPDMDASLFVLVGTSEYGPFPTTGP